MSEICFSSKTHKKSNNAIENFIQEVHDVEFWQDECLKSILEKKFNQRSIQEDIDNINKEVSEIKKEKQHKEHRIKQILENCSKRESELEERNNKLEECRSKEEELKNKVEMLKEELNKKKVLKSNLNLPNFVADLFINNMDFQGLSTLFMQLYNMTIQQQMYNHSMSYMMHMNQMTNNQNLNGTNGVSSQIPQPQSFPHSTEMPAFNSFYPMVPMQYMMYPQPPQQNNDVNSTGNTK